MKFKLKVAKLEDVAEAHRGLYVEAADKSGFVLKDEFEIADPPDVTNLTRNRDTILAEKNALELKYKDIDADAAREALKVVGGLKDKEKTDADRIAAIEKQIKASDDARVAAEQRANDQLIRAEGASAIAAAKGNATLLMPFVERRAKVVDGVLQIVGDDGKTPMLDAKGAPLTMGGLIDSFKSQDVFAGAFAASGAGGGGAPAGNTGARPGAGGKAVSRADFDIMDAGAKAAHIQTGGVVTE